MTMGMTPSIGYAVAPATSSCSGLVGPVVGRGDERVGCCEPAAVWRWQIVEAYDVLITLASKVSDGFHGGLYAACDVSIAVEALVVLHGQYGHSLRPFAELFLVLSLEG